MNKIKPVKRYSLLAVVVAGGIGLGVGFVAGWSLSPDQDSQTWRLVTQSEMGYSQIQDYDMTHEDCSVRAQDYLEWDVVYCEDESYNMANPRKRDAAVVWSYQPFGGER